MGGAEILPQTAQHPTLPFCCTFENLICRSARKQVYKTGKTGCWRSRALPAWWSASAVGAPHGLRPHCKIFQSMSAADPLTGQAVPWMQSLVYSYQH